MNLEIENVFFGAFLGFWISELLKSISQPFVTIVLLFTMTVLVFVLHKSLYSEEDRFIIRLLSHILNMLICLVIFPVLDYYFPGSLDHMQVSSTMLLAILGGTVFFWILSGELKRQSEGRQVEAEFDR